MPVATRRTRRHSFDIWPGFVDALASLLMVVIFVLMVFVVAHFYLSSALSGKDEALARLNRQLTELGELLALEREANADLRLNVAQLSAELQNAIGAREGLAAQVDALTAERDALLGRAAALSSRVDEANQNLDEVSRQLEDAFKVIAADREKIELQLREIASLQADIQALRTVRERLEGEVAALELLRQENAEEIATLRSRLEASETARAEADDALRLSEEQRTLLMAELAALRDRSQALEAELASAEERTVLAQRTITEREIRIEELLTALEATEAALTAEQQLTEESEAQIALLNQQIAALRQQLARLEVALDASEAANAEQKVQIANLSQRLNLALASKVEELARYRSEFFGRLREVLGDRDDIRIVGDRFVFQSEVLFPTASAQLGEAGKRQLDRLADTLLEVTRRIPPEIDWVLRVDGHTDIRPISTALYPSNWELSTARAVSVVKYLIERGIPPERLAAAGFGAYQPIDPGFTEEAFARNRRIELKLDQR